MFGKQMLYQLSYSRSSPIQMTIPTPDPAPTETARRGSAPIASATSPLHPLPSLCYHHPMATTQSPQSGLRLTSITQKLNPQIRRAQENSKIVEFSGSIKPSPTRASPAGM